MGVLKANMKPVKAVMLKSLNPIVVSAIQGDSRLTTKTSLSKPGLLKRGPYGTPVTKGTSMPKEGGLRHINTGSTVLLQKSNHGL